MDKELVRLAEQHAQDRENREREKREREIREREEKMANMNHDTATTQIQVKPIIETVTSNSKESKNKWTHKNDEMNKTEDLLR